MAERVSSGKQGTELIAVFSHDHGRVGSRTFNKLLKSYALMSN